MNRRQLLIAFAALLIGAGVLVAPIFSGRHNHPRVQRATHSPTSSPHASLPPTTGNPPVYPIGTTTSAPRASKAPAAPQTPVLVEPFLTNAPFASSASVGARPVIQSNAAVRVYFNRAVEYVFVQFHVNSARTVRVLRMWGYNFSSGNIPGGINHAPLHVTVVAGAFTLHHSGSSNLWHARSYNRKAVSAVLDPETKVSVRACNQHGCTSRSITLSRIP